MKSPLFLNSIVNTDLDGSDPSKILSYSNLTTNCSPGKVAILLGERAINWSMDSIAASRLVCVRHEPMHHIVNLSQQLDKRGCASQRCEYTDVVYVDARILTSSIAPPWSRILRGKKGTSTSSI